MTTSQIDELEKLRRTVEMTERVRDGYRNNLLQHVAYSVSLFQPRELTSSERYVLAMAERQVIEAKEAYREAYIRWRADKPDRRIKKCFSLSDIVKNARRCRASRTMP